MTAVASSISTAPQSGPGWAVYLRLSRTKPRKRTGRQRDAEFSVELQLRTIRSWAAAEGIPISEEHVYVDNNRSAWKRGAPRPDFDAMVAAGKRGDFPGILAYKLDRFARNVRDAEDLIDLAFGHHMAVWGPNSTKYDLRTSAGKNAFRKAAQQATEESDNASERIRPVLAENARAGYALTGPRMFGYEVTNQVELPEGQTIALRRSEVVVLREAAARLLKGEKASAIAADLNERGITTSRGKPWRANGIATVLRNRLHGGEVWHNGEHVGWLGGGTSGPTQETVFDVDTFDAIQAFFSQRRRGRPPVGAFPLSGVMRCGRCGMALVGGRSRTGTRRYSCPASVGGCSLSVVADPVEPIVIEKTLEVLGDFNILQAATDANTEWRAARAQAEQALEDAVDGMVKLESDKMDGIGQARVYDRLKPRWQARIRAAEQALEALGTTPPNSDASQEVLTARADAPAKWEPSEWRRVLHLIKRQVTVLPLAPGMPRASFDPGRIDFSEPRDI